ncbi:DNA repair protein RecN [Aliidiomarina quisquiliarum]|uniref:DNA repair protein RecN n=1 Tax=Aliidiomarina quisquiliarum TaxID=2938947 RepID=UPI00208F027B|nr:DNA repair protein RecN [Aliidiomarina quisquiliarum]MCO4321994.1 DNA repair protein RecN [Aliidiomarina quisquiliarum]
MLIQLCVRNFAIVDDLTVDFQPGMSAITGETGAGKSIALDALSLCLGARSEAGFVRAGADKAEISASFNIHTLPIVKQWLEARELDADDECLLRRTITAEGRSKAYINGAPVPVALLKEVGSHLVSLHGQHDHHQLMKQEHQLVLLDQYASHSHLISNVGEHWRTWQQLLKEQRALQQAAEQQLARRQLIEYQVNELNEFALMVGDYEQLEIEHKRLANTSALQDDSAFALNSLFDGEHNNAYSLLEGVVARLRAHQDIDSRLLPILTLLDEASVQIEEAVRELRHYQDGLDSDPAALAEADERLAMALQLARKHKIAPQQLPTLHQELVAELDSLSASSERLEQLDSEINVAYNNYQAAAEKLSASRVKAAKSLDQKIIETMKQLNMPGGLFITRINTDAEHYSSRAGIDQVVFEVSVNAGQKPQALQKVASGGELSRISLAIQVLTAEQDGLPTLVFDEVDVGVSGPTAATVGRLMRRLGESNQVICVTHLPQVAARAHHQIQVSKNTKKGATYTSMETLTEEQRVNELARLLGGDTITANTLANAQELLAG